MLNNREILILGWSGVLACYFVQIPDVRSAFKHLLSAFFAPKMLAVFVTYYIYVTVGLYIASQAHFWDRNLLKDTGIWTVATGIPLIFRYDNIESDSEFFIKEIRDLFKITIIVEFVLSLESFSLWKEFFLVPFAFLLVISVAMSKRDPDLHYAHRYFSVLLGVLGFCVLTATIWKIAKDGTPEPGRELIKNFLLSFWLPIFVLPYVFVLSLVTNYEIAFMRMNIGSPTGSAPWFSKLALLCTLKCTASQIHSFTPYWARRVAEATSFELAQDEAKEYQQWYRNRLLQ